MTLRRIANLLILMIAAAACQPSATPAPGITPAPPATSTPSLTPAAAAAPTLQPLPTPTPGHTIRFSLPLPPPEPRSIWRPPLYATPWALNPHEHFYFARPIAADEVNWPLPSYRYGGIFFGPDVPHTGIDITAKRGTPVLAAGGGTVIWAGWGLYSGNIHDTDDPYGKAVAIRHDFGYQGKTLYTVYGHLDEVLVIRGQHVEVGEVIGQVGDTGFTTGPHLHFEIRWNGDGFFDTLNPELWLVPPQGWGVLVGRIMNTNKEPLRAQIVYVISHADGQLWQVRTYGSGTVHSDPYYQENMALSDLPAGTYTVRILYAGHKMESDINILPGQVTYITFQGWYGYQAVPPATPAMKIP